MFQDGVLIIIHIYKMKKEKNYEMLHYFLNEFCTSMMIKKDNS